MFEDMKISVKLVIAFTMIGIIFITATTIFLSQSRAVLKHAMFEHLESVREDKKARVEDFFAERKNDVQVLSDIITAFYQAAIQKLERTQLLKKHLLEGYFSQHLSIMRAMTVHLSVTCALQQEETKDSSEEKVVSPQIDAHTIAEFEEQKKRQGYYDLLFISSTGEVKLSLIKEKTGIL